MLICFVSFCAKLVSCACLGACVVLLCVVGMRVACGTCVLSGLVL